MDDRIKCYAIPYGAVGFISHVFLYITVTALAFGRSPFMFWRTVAHKHIKNTLLITSLLVTLVLTTMSIARCHATLPLLLIATGKLIMAITLYYMAIHIIPVIRGCHSDCIDNSAAVLYWMLLYGLGTVMGLSGLSRLVFEDFDESERLRTASFVFIALVCSVPTIALILSLQHAIRRRRKLIRESISDVESDHIHGEQEHSTLIRAVLFAAIIFFLSFGILFALQSDWALGIIAGDMAGAPPAASGALYWSYFAFSLLPFFSF